MPKKNWGVWLSIKKKKKKKLSVIFIYLIIIYDLMSYIIIRFLFI